MFQTLVRNNVRDLTNIAGRFFRVFVDSPRARYEWLDLNGSINEEYGTRGFSDLWFCSGTSWTSAVGGNALLTWVWTSAGSLALERIVRSSLPDQTWQHFVQAPRKTAEQPILSRSFWFVLDRSTTPGWTLLVTVSDADRPRCFVTPRDSIRDTDQTLSTPTGELTPWQVWRRLKMLAGSRAVEFNKFARRL